MSCCITLVVDVFRHTRNTSCINVDFGRQFQSSSFFQFVVIQPKFHNQQQSHQYRTLQQRILSKTLCMKSYTYYSSLSSWTNYSRRREIHVTSLRPMSIGQRYSQNNGHQRLQTANLANYNCSHSSSSSSSSSSSYYSSSSIVNSGSDRSGTTYKNMNNVSNLQQQQQKYVVDQCQELYNSVLGFNNGVCIIPYLFMCIPFCFVFSQVVG
jgi:hypothetical protein